MDPIILENGSFECRAGYASKKHPQYVVRSLVAKNRARTEGRYGEVYLGEDLKALPNDVSKYQMRSPFEGNIITHFETQEHLFDHVFEKLGVESSSVESPIIVTECPYNPFYCREKMAELLFDGYGVPSICFCVDSLLSYFQNTTEGSDPLHESSDCAIVISLGHKTTHVLPVLDGKLAPGAMRIAVGGHHVTEYLLKILQLENPLHKVTWEIADEVKSHHCFVAENYTQMLRSVANDPDFAESLTVDVDVACVNIQGTDKSGPQPENPERSNKMKELGQRRRQEVLKQHRNTIEWLQSLLALIDENSPDGGPEFQNALIEHKFRNIEEIYELMTSTQAKIERSNKREAERRAKEMGVEGDSSMSNAGVPQPMDVGHSSGTDAQGPSQVLPLKLSLKMQRPVPLLPDMNVQSHQGNAIDATVVETQSRQRLAPIFPTPISPPNAIHGTNVNTNISNTQLSNTPTPVTQTDMNGGAQMFTGNFLCRFCPKQFNSTGGRWKHEGKFHPDEVLEFRRTGRRPAPNMKRSLTPQNAVQSDEKRLKESSVELTTEEKKKMQDDQRREKMAIGRAKAKQKRDDKKREIEESKANDPVGFLSDLHMRKQAILRRQEERLGRSRGGRKSGRAQKRMKAITKAAFEGEDEDDFGVDDDDWDMYRGINKESDEYDPDVDAQELVKIERLIAELEPTIVKSETTGVKIHDDAPLEPKIQISIERVRAPEIFFQPSMIGNNECGLMEALENVLSRISDPKKRSKAASNVFIGGGSALIPGFVQRICRELSTMMPIDSPVSVQVSQDPFDAWLGGAKLAKDLTSLEAISISREDWMKYRTKVFETMKFHPAACIPFSMPLNPPSEKPE